jgi:hypothetical protein
VAAILEPKQKNAGHQDPRCFSFSEFSKRSERVGFEPTWLAPIRFRGGAVMTASVPLLISRWHFSNKNMPAAVASMTRGYKLNPESRKSPENPGFTKSSI